MAKIFSTKRTDGVLKAPAGFDAVTIPVSFIPEVITVEWKDPKKTATKQGFEDILEWSLVIAGSVATLLINYSCSEPREIRYVASIPTVDPEATISF